MARNGRCSAGANAEVTQLSSCGTRVELTPQRSVCFHGGPRGRPTAGSPCVPCTNPGTCSHSQSGPARACNHIPKPRLPYLPAGNGEEEELLSCLLIPYPLGSTLLVDVSDSTTFVPASCITLCTESATLSIFRCGCFPCTAPSLSHSMALTTACTTLAV